jgi:tetratricopeptide (TPR) repeat protein
MNALQFILMPLLLNLVPPDKTYPQTKWDDKHVIIKQQGIQFGQFDDAGNLVKSVPVTSLEYRVLTEQKDRIQVKTQQGVTAWLKKSDAVLVEDAVGFFSERIQQNPNDVDAYSRRAWSWRLKGEHDAAIKDFTEALRLQPNAATYSNRAAVYHLKKDYDKALEDYAQALRLAPQMIGAYNNRGNLWSAKKDYDKAIEDYSTALRIDPIFALAYRNRAMAFYNKKDYDRAIDDHTKVIELDPISGQAYHDRGQIWSAKKEHEKALADFNQSLKLNPKFAPACNAAAWVLATCPHEKFRDGKRALELARQAVSIVKYHPGYLDTLAAAHAELGNFDEAVRFQEQALQDASFKKDASARERLELYKRNKPYRQPD